MTIERETVTVPREAMSKMEAVARMVDPVPWAALDKYGVHHSLSVQQACERSLEMAENVIALAAAPPPTGEGQPVAWYNPTNKDPGQSVTFSRADRDRWPHIYPVALYAAPTPLLDGQGSLQAASLPSVPTEGHGATVVGDWTEFEDDLSDAISDSLEMDWNSSDGARAVVRWLNENAPRKPDRPRR